MAFTRRFRKANRRTRRLWLATAIAAAAGLTLIGLTTLTDPFERPQNAATDALFREQDGSPNVVLVQIDDEALDTFGRFTDWPRTNHATAIENLSAAGARVIVYDVLFAEPSDEDEELATAIAQAGNVVLAGVGAGTTAQSGEDQPLQFADVEEPVASLADAAAAVAHANVEPDDDGRVRRVPLVIDDAQGNEYLSMSLAALYAQLTLDPPPPESVRGDSLQVLDRDIPMEEHQALRINYAGRYRLVRERAIHGRVRRVLRPRARREHKTVFVGINVAAADRHSTPLMGDAPGVVVQMNALDTMLRDRFLQLAPGWLAVVVGYRARRTGRGRRPALARCLRRRPRRWPGCRLRVRLRNGVLQWLDHRRNRCSCGSSGRNRCRTRGARGCRASG